MFYMILVLRSLEPFLPPFLHAMYLVEDFPHLLILAQLS